MASCLVPDFPAVMVALEHLKELDKQLKEEAIPFSPEASLHLTEITAAITGLEVDRRAAHEHLEVETIENSKLRHQINNLRERMSQEIMADVAAARASNAEEMEQLHKELSAVSQLQEATVSRLKALSCHNEALYPEREQVTAEHEEIVAALNEQITVKYGLQLQLDQTRERIEELRLCIAAVERDKVALQQNMALEREAFAAKKDNQSREVDEANENIKQQKVEIRKSRGELNRVNVKKEETHDQLGQLAIHMAKLESDAQRLTASRCQCEKQLEGETQKQKELLQQRETLEKELRELKEAFILAIQCLKEDIDTVEGKIEEGRASRLLWQDSLAQVYEVFKRQLDEENEVKAEHFHVSQQLKRSKLQLEERIATIVKHSKEMKEMDKQIGELLEADTINKRVFERNQEEMSGNVDSEKKNISNLEEEKRRLRALLQKANRKQEAHVAKVTADIRDTRERYRELKQEEAALQRRQPEGVDADSLVSHVNQCEVEYKQKETKHHQEIERCTAEMESIARSNEEKHREAEEKEEMLKEVEATWNEERRRHQRLKELTSELRRKRSDLELSVRGLREQTGALLRPKEEMKAELEEMRESYMEGLDKRAAVVRAAEVSIYDNTVKLEQVSVENSRLHLRIGQMKEDVSRVREDEEQCRQDTRRFEQDIKDEFQSLQEAWREDLSVTRDFQSSEGVLLVSMSAMLNHLKTRRQQIGNVSTLLHQHMLDFSKRLGYKTTTEQQNRVDTRL